MAISILLIAWAKSFWILILFVGGGCFCFLFLSETNIEVFVERGEYHTASQLNVILS